MNEIIPQLFIKKNQVKTTSKDVSEKFGKRHDRVIRSIENIILMDKDTRLIFGVSEYKDSTGRNLKMYEF